jgi:hypothetical protein
VCVVVVVVVVVVVWKYLQPSVFHALSITTVETLFSRHVGQNPSAGGQIVPLLIVHVAANVKGGEISGHAPGHVVNSGSGPFHLVHAVAQHAAAD